MDRDSLVPEDAERELNVLAMIAESDGNEATESVGQGTEQDEHSGNSHRGGEVRSALKKSPRRRAVEDEGPTDSKVASTQSLK